MSVIATALEHMLAAGMDRQAIVAAVAAMEAEMVSRAANDAQATPGALRMRRFRQRHKASQSVTSDAQVTDGDAPPNEYISNPPVLSPSPKGESPLSAEIETLTAEWNELAGQIGLSRVAGKLGGSRKAQAGARLREYGLDGMRQAMAALARSPFCRGETSDFRANFDFLIRARNATKLIEGGFDPPRQRGPSAADSLLSQTDRYRGTA